jgi:hypothetical protein
VWAGVDKAWEQEKLEARKMLENAAESHTSGARFVRPALELEDLFCLIVILNFQKHSRLTRQIRQPFLYINACPTCSSKVHPCWWEVGVDYFVSFGCQHLNRWDKIAV